MGVRLFSLPKPTTTGIKNTFIIKKTKMKRIFVLLMSMTCFLLIGQAQKEEVLKKHVGFLASEEMKGRKAQTSQSEEALKYIRTDLEKYGLECKEFFLDADSLKNENNADYTGKYHALYTIVESSSPQRTDDYLIITTQYSGFGVDTLQGYELIKYSANKTASSTVITMELAKNLKKESNNLKRGIIFLFVESNDFEQGSTIPFSDYLKKEKNIITGFNLNNLGFQVKDSAGNYDESSTNIEYEINKRIKNASKIVNTAVMNDLDINSGVHNSTINTQIPFIFIENHNYVYKYEDKADTLDYDMMNKLLIQIQKVITCFDNADLEIEEYKEENNQTEENPFGFGSSFTDKYKHSSYFGINLMPFGNNQHDYQSGTMTGKNAYAFSAGLFYRWQLSKSWALKLDANYEYLKAKRHEGNYSANVVSIPLSLLLTSGSRAMMEFDIYAGAYYDYIISGKLNGKELSFDDFKRDEWGFQWGIDLRINRFILGVYYKTPWNSVNTETYRENTGIGRIKERTKYNLKLGWRL